MISDSTSAITQIELDDMGPYRFSLTVTDQKSGASSASLNIDHLKWTLPKKSNSIFPPALGAEGIVYSCSEDGILYALYPDGSEYWSMDIGKCNSPVIDTEGILYVHSSDQVLYALFPDGTIKWTFDTQSEQASLPVLSKGTLYIESGIDSLYAIDDEGQLKWSFYTQGFHESTPAVGPDGTVITDSKSRVLYALYPDGQTKWRLWLPELCTSPAIGFDGTVYVGAFHLYAIHPDGTEKWHLETEYGISVPPVIGPKGVIYACTKDSVLLAIDSTGVEKWRFHTDGLIKSSPVIARQGTVFLSDDRGNIFTLNSDGDLIYRQEMNGESLSSATIDPQGSLYFGSEKGDFLALYSSQKGLAPSAWPRIFCNTRNTSDSYNPHCPQAGLESNHVLLERVNQLVQLDARPSMDPDGDPLLYSWRCLASPEGSHVDWIDSEGSTIDVLLDQIGQYIFSVTVSDNTFSSTAIAHVDNNMWKRNTSRFIKSSPACGQDGLFYIGSENGSLYGIDEKGNIVWRFETDGWAVSSPVIDEQGNICFASTAGTLYAIRPDHTIKWQLEFKIDTPLSVAIEPGGMIIFAADSTVYGLTNNGQIEWEFKSESRFFTSPVLDHQGNVYIGAYDGTFYALNPDGTEKWSFKASGPILSPAAIANGSAIYFGSMDGTFYALEFDGTLEWSYSTLSGSGISCSPAIGSDGTLYFGCRDHHLYALNPEGELEWRYKTLAAVHSTPAIGSDGMIYFGSMDGQFRALNADGVLEWVFKTDHSIMSSPVLTFQGNLVFGSMDFSVYALVCNSMGLCQSAWPKFRGNNANSGLGFFSTQIKSQTLEKPRVYTLYQNYPNPFNSDTTIKFDLPQTTNVLIQIFNIQGQLVETIIEGNRPAGENSVIWNSSGYSSGSYFIKFRAGDHQRVQKCLILN